MDNPALNVEIFDRLVPDFFDLAKGQPTEHIFIYARELFPKARVV